MESVGLALYKKRGTSSWPQFRVLFEAFRDLGAEMITHVGEPLEGDLEELADVVEWIDAADGVAPGCVAEAFEPEIRLDGEIVHRAKLVCVLPDPAAMEPSRAEPFSTQGSGGSTSQPPQEVREVVEGGERQ